MIVWVSVVLKRLLLTEDDVSTNVGLSQSLAELQLWGSQHFVVRQKRLRGRQL